MCESAVKSTPPPEVQLLSATTVDVITVLRRANMNRTNGPDIWLCQSASWCYNWHYLTCHSHRRPFTPASRQPPSLRCLKTLQRSVQLSSGSHPTLKSNGKLVLQHIKDYIPAITTHPQRMPYILPSTQFSMLKKTLIRRRLNSAAMFSSAFPEKQ